MNKFSPHHRTQRGASLIEVLVAVLIFSFGLLGLVGLQSRAMQFTGDADGTNRAAALASEITSQMYVLGTGDTGNATLSAAIDTWKLKVADPASGGLSGGTATVTYTSTATPPVSAIEIKWTTPSNPLSRRYTTQFFNPVAGGVTAPPVPPGP
jgi:type IV pilus assembly protein PilV